MIDWPPEASDPITVAVGWATVELERAAEMLGPLLRSGARFEVAPASRALGARCLVGWADGLAGRPIRVVLLEPSTEGRLAGSLARTGEAWAASWRPAPGAGAVDPGRHVVRVWRPGPLGAEWLQPDDRVAGPFRFLVEAATIEP